MPVTEDLRLCPPNRWLVRLEGAGDSAFTRLRLTCTDLAVEVQNGAYAVTHGSPAALGWAGASGGAPVAAPDACPDGWIAGMLRTGWAGSLVLAGYKCVKVELTY